MQLDLEERLHFTCSWRRGRSRQEAVRAQVCGLEGGGSWSRRRGTEQRVTGGKGAGQAGAWGWGGILKIKLRHLVGIQWVLGCPGQEGTGSASTAESSLQQCWPDGVADVARRPPPERKLSPTGCREGHMGTTPSSSHLTPPPPQDTHTEDSPQPVCLPLSEGGGRHGGDLRQGALPALLP